MKEDTARLLALLGIMIAIIVAIIAGTLKGADYNECIQQSATPKIAEMCR